MEVAEQFWASVDTSDIERELASAEQNILSPAMLSHYASALQQQCQRVQPSW